MKRPHWLILVVTLLFFWLALNSMLGDSPTMDEQNHLARGLAFLRTGDPRLSLEHPPLINTISALPLLTLDNVALPTDHPSWTQPQGWYQFAELLLWQYNHDVSRMIFLARLPIVFLTLGLALLAFQFARTLWGHLAGMLAYIMILFDPNIMAHGRYVTTDLGGMLFALLALFACWRLWQTPGWSWRRLLIVAFALGLAYSSKLSILVFLPILATLAILAIYPGPNLMSDRVRRLTQLVLANILALAVIWAVFGFQWGALSFANPALAVLNGINAPMPTYWAGIEQILLITDGGRPSFLLGQTSTTGFLAYFPVAFLVKTPLPTLIILVASLILHFVVPIRKIDRARATFLLLPALLYFLVSMQSGLNIGYRHLLPILPLLYIAGAGALVRLTQRYRHTTQMPARRLLMSIYAATPVVALIAVTVWLHPHYLSFFNIIGGGPANGHELLVDSNIDWGQDLIRLKQWMDTNQVQHINLSWFGSADPNYYDITYDPLPGLPRHFDLWWNVPFNSQNPEPGIYAISVSNLWELPLQEEKYVFPWFREREPDDRVGYSILIYDVAR